MATIEERWETRDARGRRNNFDALRLVAASLVIIGHSFQIAESRHGDSRLGVIGVLIFFAISGFLIAKSWMGHPRGAAFAGARALRILPALAVNVLILAFVVGPLVTVTPLGDYFRDPQFRAFLANALLINETSGLPGVFATSSFPGSMNPPYWTLAYEAACYGVVLALGRAGLLDWRGLLTAFILLLTVMTAPRLVGGEVGAFLKQWSLVGPTFMTGALAAVYGARIRLSGALAALSLAVLVLTIGTPRFQMAFPFAGTYLVLFLALAPAPRLWNAARRGDLSYGLYIWGWPSQQVVAMALPAAGGFINLALAFPMAAGLALLSWVCVEKPALALKDRFRTTIASAPKPAARRKVALG